MNAASINVSIRAPSAARQLRRPVGRTAAKVARVRTPTTSPSSPALRSHAWRMASRRGACVGSSRGTLGTLPRRAEDPAACVVGRRPRSPSIGRARVVETGRETRALAFVFSTRTLERASYLWAEELHRVVRVALSFLMCLLVRGTLRIARFARGEGVRLRQPPEGSHRQHQRWRPREHRVLAVQDPGGQGHSHPRA